MSNKQQSIEPAFAAIAGNIPQVGPAGRKRKASGLPDSPSEGVYNSPSQGSSYRPLRKRPTLHTQQPNHSEQSSSSSIGATAGFEVLADNAPSLPKHGDTPTIDDLFGLNNPAPYTWEGMSSGFDLVYPGAQENIPREEGVGICPRGKPVDQELTGSTRPSFVACPLRSHLEKITSLAVVISRVSRRHKSAPTQPLCEVEVETLLQQLENLQQSYLELRECVQQPIPSLRGGPTLGMS